ncbi:hypothetical protein CEXT_506831 [Caerostris extrusa]|uniref:Uncharacterized protein n=1 Tax=Caerostris extrusa TaxID=172846 RepID=A0AAV4TME2_CAEEX|nr:hypothetical protein CEXT_506831 [Caerostris extrusa]
MDSKEQHYFTIGNVDILSTYKNERIFYSSRLVVSKGDLPLDVFEKGDSLQIHAATPELVVICGSKPFPRWGGCGEQMPASASRRLVFEHVQDESLWVGVGSRRSS